MDAQEHTRELQLEDALKTLKEALNLQKDKKFNEAKLKYDELSQNEVIKNKMEWNDTWRELMYSKLRNGSILRLRILIDEISVGENKSKDEIFSKVSISIFELIDSLNYGMPDLRLIQVLSTLFNHLKLYKLAKLILELEISNDNDELSWDVNRPHNLLPDQCVILDDYLKLVDLIDEPSKSNKIYKQIKVAFNNGKLWTVENSKAHYEHHEKIKQNWEKLLNAEEFNNHMTAVDEPLIIDVAVSNGRANIDDIFLKMHEVMPKPKGRRKIYDGYVLTNKIVDCVRFSFEEKSVVEIEKLENTQIDPHEIITEEECALESVEVPVVHIPEMNVHEEKPDDDPQIIQVQTSSHEDLKPVLQDQIDENLINDSNEPAVELPAELIHLNENSDNFEHMDVDSTPIQAEIETEMVNASVKGHELENDNSISRLSSKDEITQQPQITSTQITSSSKIQSKERKRNTRSRLDIVKQPLSLEMFEAHDIFLSKTMNDFLKNCKVEFSISPLSKYIVETHPLKIDGDLKIKYFIHALTNWKTVETESLLAGQLHNENRKKKNGKVDHEGDGDGDDDDDPLKEIFTFTTFSNPDESNVTFEEIDDTGLYDLLEDMNKKKLHLNIVRINLLNHLFKPVNLTGGTILTNSKISKQTLKNVKLMLDTVSLNMFQMFEDFNDEGFESYESLTNECNTAISVVEILIDSYLGAKQDQKLKNMKHKSVISEYQYVEQLLASQIQRWIYVLDDAFKNNFKDYKDDTHITKLWIRYQWCKIMFSQNSEENEDLEKLIESLQNISLVCDNVNVNIKMVNFDYLSPLNKQNVEIQLSKLKIMKTFSEQDNSNKLLENILLSDEGKSDNLDPNTLKIENEMRNYVNTSSVDLKFKLWSILLNHYRETSNLEKYQRSLEKVLKVIIQELNLENLSKMKENFATQLVVRCIGFFGLFVSDFVKFFAKYNFKLYEQSIDIFRDTLTDISFFFELCYTYLMYQDSSFLTHGRKSLKDSSQKAFVRMNDIVTSCCVIFAMFHESALPEKNCETINDFLSYLHGELGVRLICQSLNGLFLQYLQSRLLKLNWDGSENDILQVIHCRFGHPITTDSFETYDHQCKPIPMNKSDALELADFIVSISHKKKHPILSPPKNDIKAILDSIMEVIGEPDSSNHEFKNNSKIIKKYLSTTDFTVDFVVKAFKGELILNLLSPDSDSSRIIKKGVNYLQALLALHFYKMRRKTMQGRIAELDFVIKMLQMDLVSGVDRFESWLLLGQSFSYLVEDDLIWTADKINVIEKKKNTAFLQKKSLSCYFMAINIFYKMDEAGKESIKSIIPILWNSFAKELYNAWYDPMNKLAMHVRPTKAAYNIIYNDFEMTSADLPMDLIENNLPTRVVLKLLEISFGFDLSNWYNLNYLAKTKLKIDGQDMDYIKILNDLCKACEIANKISNKEDPIVEPHYRLFVIGYKLFESKKLSADPIINQWKNNLIFASVITSETEENFYELSVKILLRIQSYDKKKWQHRAVYRLSKIYYDHFKDFKAAKTEIGKIVNLKANSRTLLTIWKAEHERPGKHYIYNSTYINFVCQILFKLNDFTSLNTIVKKLRKMSYSFITLTRTFDNATSKTCMLIRKITNMPDGALDVAIQKLRYPEFLTQCKHFLDSINGKTIENFSDEQQLILFFINETQTIRKTANGYGATGFIDEVYHTLFLMLFVPFLTKKCIFESSLDIISILQKKLYINNKNEESIGANKSTPVESTPLLSPTPTNLVINEVENLDVKDMNSGIDSTVVNQNQEVKEYTQEEKNEIENSIKSMDIIEMMQLVDFIIPTKSTSLITNREKSKVARRDITPFTQQLISSNSQLFDQLVKKWSDPDLLVPFENFPPVSDAEMNEFYSAVYSRITKEFKEEKELDVIYKSNDRSLTGDELSIFNELLIELGVNPLKNPNTITEIKAIEEKRMKEEQERKIREEEEKRLQEEEQRRIQEEEQRRNQEEEQKRKELERVRREREQHERELIEKEKKRNEDMKKEIEMLKYKEGESFLNQTPLQQQFDTNFINAFKAKMKYFETSDDFEMKLTQEEMSKRVQEIVERAKKNKNSEDEILNESSTGNFQKRPTIKFIMHPVSNNGISEKIRELDNMSTTADSNGASNISFSDANNALGILNTGIESAAIASGNEAGAGTESETDPETDHDIEMTAEENGKHIAKLADADNNQNENLKINIGQEAEKISEIKNKSFLDTVLHHPLTVVQNTEGDVSSNESALQVTADDASSSKKDGTKTQNLLGRFLIRSKKRKQSELQEEELDLKSEYNVEPVHKGKKNKIDVIELTDPSADNSVILIDDKDGQMSQEDMDISNANSSMMDSRDQSEDHFVDAQSSIEPEIVPSGEAEIQMPVEKSTIPSEAVEGSSDQYLPLREGLIASSNKSSKYSSIVRRMRTRKLRGDLLELTDKGMPMEQKKMPKEIKAKENAEIVLSDDENPQIIEIDS